jgi:glutamyl/glutaminyl-tRNA synthetase
MKRLDRYKEVAEKLLSKGLAYWAYETKEELDAMREGADGAGREAALRPALAGIEGIAARGIARESCASRTACRATSPGTTS